jgi:anti-anti-sigma regulatory factor
VDTLSVTVVVIDHVTVDYATGDAFLAQLESAVGDGDRAAIVDLSRVARIGTVGLRALIEAAKRTRAFFGVVAPQPGLRELLSIGRVDAIVPVFASVDDARSAVSGA